MVGWDVAGLPLFCFVTVVLCVLSQSPLVFLCVSPSSYLAYGNEKVSRSCSNAFWCSGTGWCCNIHDCWSTCHLLSSRLFGVSFISVVLSSPRFGIQSKGFVAPDSIFTVVFSLLPFSKDWVISCWFERYLFPYRRDVEKALELSQELVPKQWCPSDGNFVHHTLA